MENQSSGRMSTKKIVLAALLTALVVILQFMGAVIHFGTFSISMVLIPIVIGAATCGAWVGGWLGLVFGFAVLMSGDAGLFLAVNAPGTILVVLLKGFLCGYIAGLSYKLIEKYNKWAAVIVSAVVCPVVNTGVFLVGCFVFFMDTLRELAMNLGYGDNVGEYIIYGLVGGNFLFELILNLVVSPVIVRLLKIEKKD